MCAHNALCFNPLSQNIQVEKIMRAAAEADELDEAERESIGMNMNLFQTQNMYYYARGMIYF